MSSYETNYLKGFFSALIMAGMITIMFYVVMPVWASFSYNIEQSSDMLGVVYPLSGFTQVMVNLSASINVAFFLIIIFPIIYILILPFMKEPQESVSDVGGYY